MLHEPWLDVKHILSVVQNTLVYIKCISTSQKNNQITTKFTIKWI